MEGLDIGSAVFQEVSEKYVLKRREARKDKNGAGAAQTARAAVWLEKDKPPI